MKSIKELVFTETNRVVLTSVEDGHLVYSLHDLHTMEEFLTFKVPPEDQLGATFCVCDSPKLYMRWIRKEVERQKVEADKTAAARKAWEEELAAKAEEA